MIQPEPETDFPFSHDHGKSYGAFRFLNFPEKPTNPLTLDDWDVGWEKN